jgi:hypothetical protein
MFEYEINKKSVNKFYFCSSNQLLLATNDKHWITHCFGNYIVLPKKFNMVLLLNDFGIVFNQILKRNFSIQEVLATMI